MHKDLCFDILTERIIIYFTLKNWWFCIFYMSQRVPQSCLSPTPGGMFAISALRARSIPHHPWCV